MLSVLFLGRWHRSKRYLIKPRSGTFLITSDLYEVFVFDEFCMFNVIFGKWMGGLSKKGQIDVLSGNVNLDASLN